jgi:hypothetical protein
VNERWKEGSGGSSGTKQVNKESMMPLYVLAIMMQLLLLQHKKHNHSQALALHQGLCFMHALCMWRT